MIFFFHPEILQPPSSSPSSSEDDTLRHLREVHWVKYPEEVAKRKAGLIRQFSPLVLGDEGL
jgi:hypothetical protein